MESGFERDKRITDDVHFVPVEKREGFSYSASGGVFYFPVRKQSVTLGYLWWSDPENAAGFVPDRSAGSAAFNAAAFWSDGLHRVESQEKIPSRMVARIAEEFGGDSSGRVDSASPGDVENLQALKELARS